MSYQRVIPRDLFNEANLLKCYGQIYLNLERLLGVDAELDDSRLADCADFGVVQDPSSGGISLLNVLLRVRGRQFNLHRPLNSRHPWPLWLTDDDDLEIRVFAEDGKFSAEMLKFLGVPA